MLQLHRMNKSRDLMGSAVTIVTNSVLCPGNLPRSDFRCSQHIESSNCARIYVTRLAVGIISLCICVSSHLTVHLGYNFY